MKNMLKNKKGFTLVELLAVIVILALLIVITANTVLPMMNNSKESGLRVEAQRILNLASGEYQLKKMQNATVPAFTVSQLLGSSENYVGCVFVEESGNEFIYTYEVYDKNNKMKITGTDEKLNAVSSSTKTVERNQTVPATEATTNCK